MKASQVINEWLQDAVDEVKGRIEQFIGDFEDPGLTPEEQRYRVDQLLNTGEEPDIMANHIAEHVWTLAIDVARDLGHEEGSAIMIANMACKQLGYPRVANAEALAKLRKRYRQKTDLGAALRALHYDSFAAAVNDLEMGEKDPKSIEQELIYRALSQGVRTPSRRNR